MGGKPAQQDAQMDRTDLTFIVDANDLEDGAFLPMSMDYTLRRTS
jgi:hypothetical protein